jgi:hypothetical protein
MSTNKKKEKVAKKKEEPSRDLTLESYPRPEIKWEPKYRLTPAVIDSPPIVRMYEPPMHNDVFLNYLEWKVNRPWHKRLFLP